MQTQHAECRPVSKALRMLVSARHSWTFADVKPVSGQQMYAPTTDNPGNGTRSQQDTGCKLIISELASR